MAGVSVEAAAVAGAISLCNQSIQNFSKTSTDLSRKYQSAGVSWKDDKYRQLGGIINDCNNALNKPVKELQDCIKKLTELQKAIAEYEQTSIK